MRDSKPAPSRGRAAPTALAAVLGVLGVLLGALPTYPASAARAEACTAGDGGVTVVVDFSQLGGGIRASCATGLTAASRGDDALAAAGISWSPPTGQPGFVCRLAGRPTPDEDLGSGYTEACAGTPPGDASWSYWKSRGDGTWSYSSNGLTSSRVAVGGFEGWVFGRGTGTPPDYTPIAAAPAVVEAPAPAPEPPPPAPAPEPPAAPAPAPAPRATPTRTSSPAPSSSGREAPTTSSPAASSASAEPEGPPTQATPPATSDPPPSPATPTPPPTTAAPAPPAPATSGSTGPTTAVPEVAAATPAVGTASSVNSDDPRPGAFAVLCGAALIALVVAAAVVVRRRAPRDDL